jgi:hypothetical protein
MPNTTQRSIPIAIFLGLAAIAACIVWAGSVLGREIRCAGYFSGRGGVEEVRAVAMKRAQGTPISERDEEVLLAGARMAGCWLPHRAKN